MLEPLEPRLMLDGSVMVSEFMASNDDTILDREGNASDWIELYNPTDAPVSLNGWFLTDKTGNLDKWQIPDVTLAAAGHPGGNDYLLVFASGKNDDYPYWDGEYYHTNFTLSKEGESVLLVRSDGTTVEHGYEDYPDQITDISYGVHIGGTWNTLVDFGDSFTYLVPTPGDAGDLPDSGVSEGWTDEIFDDSNWSHDTVNGAKRLLVTEINTGDSEYVEIQNASRDLVDVNGWVVLINDPATDINAVNSTAWSLSGTMNAGEILSRNDTEWGGIDWELEGPGWAMILDDAGKVVDFVPWGYTELEIAAMSVDYGAFTGITPGDYWGGDGAAPGPGEVTSRTGNFDTDSANDFERSNNPTAGVQNAELTMPFGLIVPNQTGIGFANEQDEFETVIQTRVDHVMKEPEVGDPNASIWIRIEFDVASILGHESLTLRMKYDDGFVAYLNGAEVASANAPVTLATDSAATATQSNVQAVIYQDYDITPFMGLLHTVGTNVLAIHGLNVDAVDDDFLIQPQLVAGSSISDPRFFGIPTPGGANNPTVGAPADEVRFSRLGETFTEASFTVSLSTESPDTTIYYTRDGTVPSETSIVYTGPLTISNTTQVRARAYQPGQAPGPVNTETYIGLASDIQTHTSDIPIVIVETFGGAVGGGAKQISHISIFEPGTGGWTHITGDHALETRGGIKTRGSSTSGQSFSVESWDDHINDDDDIEPLGMPGESDWILYSSSFDKSKMNNSFIYELSNQVGQYAVRTRHVEFFLNTGGGDVSWADRKGVFVFMEKIKRGSDRVDVEALDPTDNTEPDISGGYMFKVDRLDPGDGGFNAGGQGLGWVYPKEIVIETPQYNAQENWIKNYLNQYYAALNGAGFVNPSTGLHYSDYLDVAASIDHHILNEFTKNPDEFRLSTYLYKPRDGKFAWGPIWDFDRALGFEGRSANPVGWWSDFRWGGWWSRMFNDAEFSQAWIDRYFELRANEFSHTNLQSIIDTQAATIQNSAQSYDGGWSTHRYNLKNWVTNRINWMDSQFRPMAQFSRSNGQVTPGTNVTFINLPASGNIYYTTDGTDPRAAGGGVVGQLYTGAPITINDNTKIIARVYDASATASAYCFSQVQWGASSELVVVIDTPADSSNLAITEINYNPYDPTVGELAVDSAFTSEDFEFVEITNTSTLAIALGGVKVVDGFDFEFDGDAMLPAGERAVVVANQSAFTARYGGGIPLFGEYGVGYQAPHLSNTGEGIGLVDFLGIDILNFRFNDSGSWPGRADGKGAVLEVIDPAGDYNDPSNWRSSVAYGGTPGAEAEAPLGVAINEVLSHTDLPDVDSIELYNTTGVIVDISGWYLSDSWGWASSPDNGDYKKFQIPGGTSIPVGGYLVFNEDDFNSSVGVDPLDFALDAAHGDDVWLMKTDGAGNLTHFADHVGFGAAANGESFGRWPNGVGDLYPMTLVTLEGSNSPPRVGPVIITEVMYNPPDPDGVGGVDPDDLEFIEIYNPTGSEIALSAWTDNPHGGAQYFADWRLRGGVDMEFDEGTTIAADGTLVVLSFDPNNPANATRVANFRTYYGIDASIPLTGGYGGRLDDDGERIELQRPDSPPLLEPGFAPHLTEDEVRYSDIAPWPVAPDGNGDSLHRVHSEIFGDNAGSWRSGGPTPGATSGFSMPPVVITPVDDVGVDEDSPPSVRDVSATFDDPDPGDTLTLSVSGNTNPGLVTTDLTAGILTLSYVADVNGTASIAVRATDQLGAWTEDTFTVTVASINDAPPTVIEPVVDVTVDEDSDDSIVHLSNVFDDVDFGDTLVLSLTGNTNTGLVVPSMLGNRLALSYVTDQNGTADITVRATDSGGLWVEDTFTVTVDPTNDAPAVVGPINGVIADEDDPDMIVDLANVFDDIDVGDTLSLAVSANSNTDILTANVIGTNLTLSFLPDQNGTADITIRATDSAVPGLWVEDTFTVTVNPVNDAPVMDEMPDRTLNEDTSLGSMVNLWKYVLDIEDEDRLLTFSITDNTNPDCGVSVHSDRLMDIVPAPNWYGYSDVTIEVQDLDGASDSGTFRITVNPLNDEPTVVAPIDDVFVDEDDPDTIIDLSGVFDDVDPTDTLTLLVVSNTNPSLLSAGVIVDTLTLSYIADQHGTADITIRATDSGTPELWVDETFTVTVAPVDDAPTVADPIDDVVVFENDPDTVLNLAPAFADVDIGDMLTLSVSNNSNPGLVTAELTGSQLTLSYLPDQVGTAEITIRATDSSTPGLWVDDTFTVTVNPDNFAPTVSNPIADMTIDAGAPDTVMYLSDVFADNTGVEPTLDYTAIEIDPVTGAPSAGTGLFGYKFTLYGHDGADASFATTSLTFTGPIQQLLAFGSANVDDEFFANTFEGIAGSGYIAALDTWINQGWQLIAPGDTSLSGTPVVVSASSGTSTLYQSKDILHLVATGAVQWDGLFARRGKTYETSGTADGNRLVLSVEDNTNMDLVTASMLGSRLTLAYAPGAAGQADITVRATDPEGAWIEETFTVTVVGSGTEVVARHVFYNNSVWDGNDPAAGSSDDGAIATDKMVLLPAGAASSSNYSSYSRGINGIMVDFDYLGVAPTADDFGIRVNELGYSDTWSPGPTPTVTVRPGDGVSGSDRVTLIWADGAITNTWLEVTVKSGGGINLEADDVFYFGNAVGEADGDSVVGTGDYDVLIAQFGQRGSPLDADFNGDAMVDLADFAIVRSNYGKILPEAPVLSGDADGNGVVDGVDYEILVGQFGRRGASLVGDFNGDQRVDLTDFAILRGNLGNTLPPAAPVVPVASPSLDIRNAANADDSSITAGGPAPVVDLLAEFPSADDHIPISPPVSVGSSATTFYRAATVGYDLRSLSDDLPTDAESDLSADILAESLLNGSYQLLTVSFQLR